jgi:hypothetical protein
VTDLFDEVDEQLRSDWYSTRMRQAVPWMMGAIAAILLVYLGYWGFKAYQDRNLAKATSEYQTGVDALAQNDPAGAYAHFDAAVKAGAPAYKSLALMQQASLRLAAGKPDEAARLDDAAAAAAPNLIFGDLARLKAAQALLDSAPYPQLQSRLEPLTQHNHPYWVYAREALAMAKLLAGKTDEAKGDFQRLAITLGVTDDMRQRAQTAEELIDSGEAPIAIAAAKIAATLPPPPPSNAVAAQPQADGQEAPSQSPAGAAQ